MRETSNINQRLAWTKENRDNRVTLHDDDPQALDKVLKGISRGSLDTFSHPFFETPGEKHRQLVKVLPLIHKYDCSNLEYETFDRIQSYVAALTGDGCDGVWNTNSFFEGHYDPSVEIYVGTDPGELHTAFARAWQGLRRKGCAIHKMNAVVEASPALALSLSEWFCDKLNETDMAVQEVKAIAMEAQEEIRKAKDAADEAKGTVEEVKKALEDAEWSVYNMAEMVDFVEGIVRGH